MAAKTVAQKIQIKPTSTVWIDDDDASYAALITPLPDGAEQVDALAPTVDVAVLFAHDRAALEEIVARHLTTLASVRAPWISYPKGGRSDINRDSIWKLFGTHGWTATSNIALDETWSAIRVRPMTDSERAAHV